MSLFGFIIKNSKVGRRFIVRFFSLFESGLWRSHTLRLIFKKYLNIQAGFGSYGWDNIDFKGPVVIGKYCSIGPGVKRFEKNHFVENVTTHPCVFSPRFGWVKNDPRVSTLLCIGNDVWIGANAVILPNVTSIGTGAIVAAGAVVSKNIPPYEIWGGVPAKFIRNRFDPHISKQLLQSNWWDLDENLLSNNVSLFNDPISLLNFVHSQQI